MDDDVAYCLNRFIDDQVDSIDERIEKIRKKESDKCAQIEADRLDALKKKPPPKNKGTRFEDQALVDRFIKALREDKENTNTKKRVIDDPVCIDTLRADISTKMSACVTYVNRLHNLANPFPKTAKFQEACNEAVALLRQVPEFEKNFQSLMAILEKSDASNVVQNAQKWWTDTYGSSIADLNRRNQKLNPAITDNGFVILSPTSRVIDGMRKLIAARKFESVPSLKADIVRRFVSDLLRIDEEGRDSINGEELQEQLMESEIEGIVDYVQKWVEKRDQKRNVKEVDPFEGRLESVKAEYGRQRIAQQAQKLALAALLCRLAIGSADPKQFDEKLKKTINKQKQKDTTSFPIVSGDIKNPETETTSMKIKLNADQNEAKQWAANQDGIQEKFSAGLCEAFELPNGAVNIENVDPEEQVIVAYAKPPYGKKVVESLNGTDPECVKRMAAVKRICEKFHLNVESITLGEFDLKIEDRLMDPRWNKKYGWADNLVEGEEAWSTPINQGGKPYYTPSGWHRFGVKVAENGQEFDAKWGNWYMAYHGTRGENAVKILTTGLRVSTEGCFYEEGVPRVYVSPSIEYCAHPRYAFPWKKESKNGETIWYQLVFQCRVNPESVDKIGPETLIPPQYKNSVKVDPNFNNNELEWIIIGKSGQQYIKDDIICYGLMMRTSKIDPAKLTPCSWWGKSLYGDCYKKT